MADRNTTSVDALYTEGRHYPRGQNRDTGSRRSTPHELPMESAAANRMAHNTNTNQAPEDFHGPGYDNDHANDWVRGGGKGQATGKPNFDFGGAWRQKDKSISHGPGDPAVIRSPGKNTPDR